MNKTKMMLIVAAALYMSAGASADDGQGGSDPIPKDSVSGLESSEVSLIDKLMALLLRSERGR